MIRIWGFLLSNVKELINLIYCLFGASRRFTFGVCIGGYCYICCYFMGLLKMVCIYCGRNS